MADCPDKEYCSMLECVIEKAGKDAFADNTVYDTLRKLQQQIDALKNNQGVSVSVSGRSYAIGLLVYNDVDRPDGALGGFITNSTIVPVAGKITKIAGTVGSSSITFRKSSKITGSNDYTISLGNDRVAMTNIPVHSGDTLHAFRAIATRNVLELANISNASPVERYMLDGLDRLFEQTGTSPDASKYFPIAQRVDSKLEEKDIETHEYSASPDGCITIYIEEEPETIVIAGKG